MEEPPILILSVNFPERIRELRKERALSQQALADVVGIHVTQLRRYEAGTSQPSLDVLRNLAKALRISGDQLLFEEGERGPDDDFRYAFEALAKLDDDERKVIKSVLDALLLKHEAKRLAAS